ncbi:MAG: HD domain-containing phosphohydrolase [bacterium]
MQDLMCSDTYTLQAVFSLVKAMIEEKDLTSLLRQIHNQTRQLIQVDRCTVFIYDREKAELWSWVNPELEMPQIRLSLGQGIAGQAAATKKSVMMKHVAYFHLFHPANILAVPMLSAGSDLVGVIEAINKNEGDFDDGDSSLLMTFASLAATAIRDVERNIEKERFIESVVRSFGETIDARSEFTSGHSRRVAAYARNFASVLGLDERETKILCYAALLHDIGKIGIKDSILNKPGRLTEEEYQDIKNHVSYTRNILNAINFPEDLKEIPQVASSHHEQMNGGGYPSGLKGQQIHKLSKILSIIDVYESLTARDRPYRKAMTSQDALKVLLQQRETCFDSHLVDVFIEKNVYRTELRMHKRVNVDLAIEYILDIDGYIKTKDIGKGRALNISQGGILFSSDIIFPINKIVELVVYIPDERIETLAQVARCTQILPSKGFHVGLRFVNLSTKDQQRLKRYLQNLSP